MIVKELLSMLGITIQQCGQLHSMADTYNFYIFNFPRIIGIVTYVAPLGHGKVWQPLFCAELK